MCRFLIWSEMLFGSFSNHTGGHDQQILQLECCCHERQTKYWDILKNKMLFLMRMSLSLHYKYHCNSYKTISKSFDSLLFRHINDHQNRYSRIFVWVDVAFLHSARSTGVGELVVKNTPQLNVIIQSVKCCFVRLFYKKKIYLFGAQTPGSMVSWSVEHMIYACPLEASVGVVVKYVWHPNEAHWCGFHRSAGGDYGPQAQSGW